MSHRRPVKSCLFAVALPLLASACAHGQAPSRADALPYPAPQQVLLLGRFDGAAPRRNLHLHVDGLGPAAQLLAPQGQAVSLTGDGTFRIALQTAAPEARQVLVRAQSDGLRLLAVVDLPAVGEAPPAVVLSGRSTLAAEVYLSALAGQMWPPDARLADLEHGPVGALLDAAAAQTAALGRMAPILARAMSAALRCRSTDAAERDAAERLCLRLFFRQFDEAWANRFEVALQRQQAAGLTRQVERALAHLAPPASQQQVARAGVILHDQLAGLSTDGPSAGLPQLVVRAWQRYAAAIELPLQTACATTGLAWGAQQERQAQAKEALRRALAGWRPTAPPERLAGATDQALHAALRTAETPADGAAAMPSSLATAARPQVLETLAYLNLVGL